MPTKLSDKTDLFFLFKNVIYKFGVNFAKTIEQSQKINFYFRVKVRKVVAYNY